MAFSHHTINTINGQDENNTGLTIVLGCTELYPVKALKVFTGADVVIYTFIESGFLNTNSLSSRV